MDDKIMELITAKNEVTWQSLLMQLIKAEDMDPWDIDVSRLTKRYIEMLSKLKEMDFHVSGKVVLAAAILLKVKSLRLIGDDMNELDSLMRPQEEQSDFYQQLEGEYESLDDWTQLPALNPKTPQPRQRKVSVYDLISALQKALEVKHRRMMRQMPTGKLEVPEKKINIDEVIASVYNTIVEHFKGNEKLTYQHLAKGRPRHEQILTFISLLNLAHVETRKIDLTQHELFGEIHITLHEVAPVPPEVEKAEEESLKEEETPEEKHQEEKP